MERAEVEKVRSSVRAIIDRLPKGLADPLKGSRKAIDRSIAKWLMLRARDERGAKGRGEDRG